MNLEGKCLEHEYIHAAVGRIEPMSEKVNEIHTALMGTLEQPGWLSRFAAVEKAQKTFIRIATWVTGTIVTGIIGGFGVWLFTK